MFFAVCIALAIAGLALIFHGARRFLRDRRLAASAASWAKVEGEIVSASLDIKDGVGADQDRITTYRPVVRYSYVALGGVRQGSRVWLTRETFADERAARAWLAAHQAGARVTVHYDPAQPDLAALVADKPSITTAVVIAGLGAIFAFVGLSLLLEG